jgi:hypothetical protein
LSSASGSVCRKRDTQRARLVVLPVGLDQVAGTGGGVLLGYLDDGLLDLDEALRAV